MADEVAARPGVPALEKGLDVLELLAAAPGGLTQTQIAAGVGRSVSEIFRTLGVLEQRRFVSRTKPGGDYTLSLRLFHLATQHPPVQRLRQAAASVLETLAAATGLSCHLTVATGTSFTVLAQTEPDWQMGWHVKLGARFPLSLRYPSARVLAAFRPEEAARPMAEAVAQFDQVPIDVVLDDLRAVRRAGGVFVASGKAAAVLSLSCPVLDEGGHALAAVTVPLMHDEAHQVDEHAVARELRAAAQQIAARIGVGLSATS